MKILMFGPLPPKIGGITTSVKNTMNALKSKSIDTSIIMNFSSIRPLFGRYDIAHIHYVKSWKIFLALLLGKIVAKKNIFTKHGNGFLGEDSKTGLPMLHRINAKLIDGIIFLNQTSKERNGHLYSKSIVLGSLFAEGVSPDQTSEKNYIKRKKNKTYLLLYAFDKIIKNNQNIYGVDFVLENLLSLDDQYVLCFVDIRGAHRNEAKEINSDKLIYIDHEVDFLSLLSEIDIYLRPTTTDGASVALQEALLLGKGVLASDIVERPKEAIVYKNGDFIDFKNKLENIKCGESSYMPNSIENYIDFCEYVLNQRAQDCVTK